MVFVSCHTYTLYLPAGILLCCISFVEVAAQTKAKHTADQTSASLALPRVSKEVFETIAQFYEYDHNISLSADIVEKKELPQGTREKIVFTGVASSRVPAYLAFPKNQTSPLPVVLLVDGITGSKERWFEDDSWPKGGQVTKALLDAGFAVMALDAVYHGERGAENNFAGVPWPFTYPYQANGMVVQTAVEHRRAMDYLATRAQIDTSRIGMLGLSMGGAITFALSSIEPRIKAAIAGLSPILTVKEPKFVPWMPTTFANHVRPIPFLMFMGTKDTYYTMGEAGEVFERIPSPTKEFIIYQVGHEPPVEYVQMVKDWFVMHLK